MLYVRRYQGYIAHTESVTVSTPHGTVQRPVIVIYEVRP
jgi:response regulator of citrate/malate metabolism